MDKQSIQSIASAKVFVEYRPAEKQIFARDLTDSFNEPAMYTTTGKRHVARAWETVKALALTDGFCMRDVQTACQEHGIRYHYWCMVD